MPNPKPNLSILSGKYKGTKLVSPGSGTHPMGSREKLALFNMLTPYLAGAKVLDCFAGSGALGLEALSRGAAEVTFVENNPKALRAIKTNLRSLPPQNVTIFSRLPSLSPQNVTTLSRLPSLPASTPELPPSSAAALSTPHEPLRTPAVADSTFASTTAAHLTPASSSNPALFTIIISDPPYDDYQVPDYASLLAPGGILALSHPGDFDLGAITGLTLLKTSHYASCHISLFTK